MAHFSQKGSLTILQIGINMIWLWVLLVGIPFMVLVVFVILNGSNDFFTIKVPVEFEEVFIRKVPRIDSSKVHMLIADSGTISVRIYRTWQNMTIMAICFLSLYLAFLVVVCQIKNIIKSLRQGKPFDKENLKRLRVVGYVLVLFFISKQVYIFLAQKVLFSMFDFNHIELAYDKNVGILITGLIMLSLEAVFKRGVVLEEEEQLTI